MDSTDLDRKEYKDVWIAVLRNVLHSSDDEISAWMERVGHPLLLDDSIAFHEEPWFWMCSTVVSSIAPEYNAAQYSDFEKKIFWILDEEMRGKALTGIDWSSVRSRCLAIFS